MKQMKKRLLAALLSLSMIGSILSPMGSVMNVSAATTTELVNVALEAQSATTSDGVSIGNVIDGSTDTVWEISNVNTVTGIVQLNMGRSISKLNLNFKEGVGTSSAVNVTVKYAQNGVVSDLINFGSGTYNLSGTNSITMSAATPVSATHFYVELASTDGNPLTLNVSEIEIFESQEVVLSNYNNIARQANITATGGKEHPTEGSANLVDGSKSSLYKFYNDTMSSEQTITLSYDEARSMDAMVIYFESTTNEQYSYAFNYSIKAKNLEGNYDIIASNVTANRTDNYTQTYKFAEKVYSEVQIVMHSCTTSSGAGWPAVAEFEVYGSQPTVTDEGNIAIGKPVHAASGKGRAVNITDGAKDSYWTGDYYPAYVDIDLEANYNLESVEVYTPTNGYSQYSIYTSMDGRNFEKLAEKTSTASATDAGEVYAIADHDEDKAREARIVRIFMEYNSAQAAPVLNEVRVMGTPSGTAKQERPEINVKKYSETEYANKTITVDDIYAEVHGIIERRLGEAYKAWFELEIAANPNKSDYDYFELSMANGKVHVKGNDGVSLATGINHYLKYYCNVNISQVGDQVKMPASMPQLTGTVYKETKAKVRYSYNYCTLSYSMAFWGEPEWRNELDWLALNGVNVVLDATAQEEVWRRFLGKLGYSHEDAKDYIAGPAYYAWAYMANLSGFGGPVHDSWFEDRTELARKNQHIMRTLGMQPALQGYSGMVPTDIQDYDTSAPIISQGTWCSFQRPAMLVTTDAKFDEYAELFYQCQEEVYGPVSDYYATDPFHEGGNTGGMAANAISREVLTSMLKADKDAIWIIQAWQGNPTTALLNGLDEVTTNSQGETIVGAEHALVLDLYAEKTPHNQETGGSYGDEKEFDATPWVFCMLNNFGGRLGLHGHLDNLANNIPAAMNRSSHMAGIGIAPEASVNNPVLYDFLFETIWQDDASQQVEVIDLNTWLDDYAARRYGAESESANKAWAILKDTVYKASLNNLGQGAPESVVNARPATSISAASTWGNAVVSYDKVKLEEAALLLLEDYDTLKSSEGYMYDVANVLQQVLSNSAQEYHKRMVAAYSAGEVDSFKTLSAKFLEIIDYMELVTATSEYFLLGRWVEQAKALADSAVAAGDDFTVELYEINARALVTTWGSINQCESGGLKDYSNRQWAGLIGDFYKPRWERWITARTNELEGKSYESSINWFQWEWAWVRENEEFTTTATPQDLETLGKEIIEKFTSTDPNADASRDVDVNKITVTDGNHETSSTTEGAAADFVQDGLSNTMWHTDWDGTANLDDHYIIFTFDEATTIDGMRFLQRQSGTNGLINTFDLYVKTAEGGDEWQLLVDNGTLSSDRSWQIVNFQATEVTAVKFKTEQSQGDGRIFSAAAEIRFTQPLEGEEPEVNKETVEVEAGDTIVIKKKGNAPLTADMVELDTSKAKVTVTNTYVQDAAANTYLSTDKTYTNTPIWLSKCLHTFTLIKDDIYEITGIAEDGQTLVYVNPFVQGRMGFPHTEETESIQLIPQDGGGYKLVDNSQKNYSLTFSVYNVFNEQESAANIATQVFQLYRQVATVDENGNTIYTYEKANDLGTAAASANARTAAADNQYLIVAELANGDNYVLRPSNDTNGDHDGIGRNSHVVKMSDGTLKEYTSTIEIEGVTPGTTTYVTVGDTKYEIQVTGEELTETDVTVRVGQTVRIFDQSGTFDASELDKLNTGVAQAVVTPMTMNDLAANLRKNNNDLAGETISLSECLYAFNMNADGSYTIVGTTEDGATVYVNPYTTTAQKGYPNSENLEGILVTKDPNGTNTFKLTDATDDQYCLTYRGDWGVFNELQIDATNSIQYFKLYELKETAAGSGIYEYSEVSEPQNGGQYVIAAVYGDNEFVLRPSAKIVEGEDAAERNEHVARKTDTTSQTSGNEMLLSGVAVGDTDLMVGNTIYHIHVVAAEQVLTMLEGEKLVISGSEKSGTPDANVLSVEKTADDTGFEITALDTGKTSVTIDDITYHITVKEAPKEERYLEMEVGDVQILSGTKKSGKPDVDVISVEKTDEGFKITALDGGETIVEIDNVIYHITVKETQVASAIGTSRGQEVTKLTMSANNTFDLDMINLENGTVEWKVVDAAGNTVSWAAISEEGVVSAATQDDHVNTYEGFIVATVTEGDNTIEYKTTLKLTPAPTAESVRLYDIYIGEIYHTEVYYGCLYGYDVEGGKDYGYTTLEKVQEGELIYISMGSAYHNALDFFAKPEPGYALTQMGSTGSAGHYMRLDGEKAENTEFITVAQAKDGQPVAGYVQYHDIDQEATIGLVQQAVDLECHGAQGFTRKENTGNVSTTLDYRSEKLPTVKKSVYGIGSGENYRDYMEDATAEIGEYVYFKVSVQTYPITGEYKDDKDQPLSDKEIVKYNNVQLVDNIFAARDAVFIPFENIGKEDPIEGNAKPSKDITDDILKETEVGQLHEYYVAYQIQPEDVANIDLQLKNVVDLSYEYETYYSSGTYGGEARDDAAVLITTLLLDNLVVDFGLTVSYEVETPFEVQTGVVTTNYGTASISCEDKGTGAYKNTVKYTPMLMLRGVDAIPLVETGTGTIHIIAVYPASTVYYEEGFATYSEDQDGNSLWGTQISRGNGVQETQVIPVSEENSNESSTATVHYGFDGKYAAEAAGPSNGTEAVSTTAGNAASFTFTGTAADIYANCRGKDNLGQDDPTGTISVLVKNEEGGIEKLLIVNTKVAGDAAAASSVQNNIAEAWNLPVASLDMEEHGTYSVSIRHTRTQEETAEDMNPVRLDGFRVYNTLKDQTAYEVHNEAKPVFVEMRNEVLGAVNLSEVLPTPTVDAKGNKVYPDGASIYAENIAGGLSQIYGEQVANGTGKAYIVMNDATTSDQIDAASAKDLLDNGPKNELFLYPGESLVFGLEDGLENVQIGMKAVNGALTKENADAVLIEKAVEKTTMKDISGEPLELRLLYYTDPEETTAWDPLLGTMTDEQAQTIKAFTEKLVAGAATDYEKARKIYEWVNTNVTYASAADVTPYLNPYDVFTNKTAVCGGYSNLYKAMLNLVGIPSVLVSGNSSGGPHIWNAVYADGRWFHSDSTWAGYFDKGTEAFKQDHEPLRVENVKLEGENGVYIGYDHGIAAVGVKDVTGTVTVPDEFEGMPVTAISYQLLNAQYGVKVLNVGKNISYIETQSISAQMEAIHVDEENPYFESVDGVLFNNDKTELLVYPAGMKAESFTLPAETVTFDEKTAFSNTSLKNISVEEGNTKYSSYDGALYNKDQTELVMVPAGKTTIEILENATISNEAFANVNVANITIYCYENSPAHQYAEDNGIKYVLIGEPTTPTPEPTPISPEGMSVYMSGIFELSGSTSFTTTTMDDIKTAVFDDNTGTFWNSNWVNSGSNIASGNPYFMVDLGTVYKLSQVDYTPRYHSASEYWECTGNIKTLIIEVSTDGHTWTAVTGENGLDISTKIKKEADTTRFPEKVTFTEQEARYVRIGGSASFGVGDRANRSITIGELDIYGTPIAKKLATDNMAVEVSGTKELSNATAASATPEQIKTNIFDGNNATFWNSDWVSSGISKGTPYITLDLGATYQINQVDYTPRYDGGVKWHCTGNIKKLLLEVSIDGEEWTMVTADTGMDLTEKIDSTDANAFPVDIEFTMQEARYIRISGLECYGHDNNTINTSITVGELAVYGIPVAKKLPVNQMAITASGTYELTGKGENKDTNTYVATGEEVRAKIFDGAKTTFWNSDWVDSGALAVGNPYLTIDLGTNYKVSQVDYTPRFDSSAKWNCTGCIKTLVVEVSTDNVTWTKVTGENGLDIASKITSGDETLFPLAITFAEREVRYVRISGLSSTGNRSITVGELGIYGIPVIATVVPTETTDTTPAAEALAEVPAESTVVSREQMNLASLTTSTDMFYVLGDTEESTDTVDVKTTITITNNSDKVLSITKLKYFTTDATTLSVLRALDTTAFTAALASMGFDTEAEKHPEEDRKPVTEIFSDVYEDWYTEYVQYMYDNGIMSGIGGTDKFAPADAVTKAQVAQVLYNMEGKPEVTDQSACTELKDVYGDWYTDAVCWAYNAGVVTGNLNTQKFQPNANVTREQFALMLYRYAQYKGYATDATSTFENLLNADKVSYWAEAGMKWAVGTGLISGSKTEAGLDLAPQGTATRAQMAAILTRFFETVK